MIFVSRIGVAALLGVAIGFEREWRMRAAGLQTGSLVAVGAALFALLDDLARSHDERKGGRTRGLT